jgi:hypothetical protein
MFSKYGHLIMKIHGAKLDMETVQTTAYRLVATHERLYSSFQLFGC